MIPTSALIARIPADLATDALALDGTGAALHVHLSQQAFTPGPGLTLADLLEASFVTYAALNGAAAPATVYIDPVSGLYFIEVTPPVGGWHFGVTAGTNLPQTIYGSYLTDNADAVLLGAELFTTPLVLSAIGQGFDLPPQRFQLFPTPLS